MRTNDCVVVFDLDDTLYKEIDYLCSAYREIAVYLETAFSLPCVYDWMLEQYEQKKDVFGDLIRTFHLSLTKERLLSMYHNHIPDISLDRDTVQVLTALFSDYPLGLITDGRSVMQRHKIQALDLMRYFQTEEQIVISEEYHSEKPAETNYRHFEELYPGKQFVYVGDNVSKDFVTPNRLGWKTFCLLDDGRNIHAQSFDFPEPYLPHYKIRSIKELLSFETYSLSTPKTAP